MKKDPLPDFPRYFCCLTLFQKYVRYFFDQVARDVKGVLTLEWPLKAELKDKYPKEKTATTLAQDNNNVAVTQG